MIKEAYPQDISGKRIALVSDPDYRYREIGIFGGLRSRIFTLPHVGLAILAAELNSLGAQTDFFHIHDPRLPQKTKDYNLVGFSVNTIHADKIVQVNREITPPVVVGGIFPSINRNWVAEHAPRVIRVIGEGENLIPRILHDLGTHDGTADEYFRPGLLDMESEYILPSHEKQSPYFIEMNAIEAGRGCPFGCNFCSPTVFDRSVRSRNIDQLKDELTKIAQDPIKRRIPVVFVDNNLTIYSKEYLHAIFNHVNRLGLLWGGEGTSTDRIINDEELLLKMSKNCIGFYTGIEDVISADVSSSKSRKFGEIKRIVETYKRVALPAYYSLVIGTDTHQYPSSFYDLRDMVKDLGILVNVHIVVPHPGTPFYRQIAENGRIIDTNFSHYNYKHVVFEPKNMSPKELLKGYFWLKRSFALDFDLNRRIIGSNPKLTPLVLEAGLQALGETFFRGYRHIDRL